MSEKYHLNHHWYKWNMGRYVNERSKGVTLYFGWKQNTEFATMHGALVLWQAFSQQCYSWNTGTTFYMQKPGIRKLT
jgi:hypothetical protein